MPLRRWLPAPLIGVLTFVLMFVALMWSGVILFLPVALLRLVMPVPAWRRALGGALVWIANGPFVGNNGRIYTLLHGPRTGYGFEQAFDPQQSWLLICNHQSWADILILFDAFQRRAPFARFFLKKQLIWVPLIGFICWSLDMPFMQRNSREAIGRNPALRNRDLETTRRFCEKYRRQPITVVNFLEGTRFTEAKRRDRKSPYAHLLRPKSAGMAFMLGAMGEQFAGIIDVTLRYAPSRRSILWSFLCGEQSGVELVARRLPIPPEFLAGDYQDDAEYRTRFQAWINALWAEKDRRLAGTAPATIASATLETASS